MNGIVITSKGAEHIAALELSELIDCSRIQKQETIVKFRINNLMELCTICYKAQSVYRVLFLLAEFKVSKSLKKSLNEIKSCINKTNFSAWSKIKNYRVECERHGEHDFKSVDIGTETGKLIKDRYKLEYGLNLIPKYDDPELSFYLYIYDDKGFLGVDFAGFELAKRQYKIFNHPQSLKGVTGYVLVRESGFRGKKVLVDPFMGSGVIVIEAALFKRNFPVHYYDKDRFMFTGFDFFKKHNKFFNEHDSKILKRDLEIYGFDSQLRFLKAAQKNAKLAGITKMNLSKLDVEWLDTRFNKDSVDCIVSDPPRATKKAYRFQSKVYNEFFHQASYVLKKRGIIVLLAKQSNLLIEAAEKHNFKLRKIYALNQGKEIFDVLTFKNG